MANRMVAGELMGSWRSYVIKIGDSCSEYPGHVEAVDHIETCNLVICRDLSLHEDEILDLLLQCIEELPHKHPMYGCVAGLVNLEESEFVAKLVNRVHENLQDALNAHDCNRLRIYLRFLAVLMCSNVISSSSLVQVYETLLSSAATTVDEDGGNPAWQPRADFYVFCILASLPWCGLELLERAPEELERVVAAVEAYFSLRIRAPSQSLRSLAEGDEDHEFLEDLWARLQRLAEDGWKLESVPRPHLALEARLATSQSHQLEALVCPENPKPEAGITDVVFCPQWREAECKYPQRNGHLRIFPPEKSEEKMTPIDRFIVEEYVLDILFYLNGCRKECASFLVQLPVPFRYEYLMAEIIFSQLLLLPKPPFKLVYYTVVMIDLCKALPGAFPPVIAAALRAMFNKVGDLDVECQYRLIQWLSHHLSNFQFVWPWEEWGDVLDQPIWSPQRVFVQEVIEKEIRLSYWDRIKQSFESVPKLVELLPPKNTPVFKFAKGAEGSSAVEAELAGELTSQIKAKKNVKEIQSWFEAKVIPFHGQKAAIEVLVQSLLNLGSKSFTHMVTVLERYGQLITKVATEQSLQTNVVEQVASFWQNSSQMTSITIDRMMGYRLISNLAIVNWVFSPSNVDNFHTSARVWEVLRNAINKTINRTSDLEKDIESAERALKDANASVDKTQTNLVAAQSAVESAQADDVRKQATAKMEWVKTTVEKAKARQSSALDLLETKQALLSRALNEQQTLFLWVYKSFVGVLNAKLSKAKEGVKEESDVSLMEIDGEAPVAEDGGERRNERYERSRSSNEKSEQVQQWIKCTLGHLRAICRQYTNEVWCMIGKLDAEVFTENVHPEIVRAVNVGLRRR